jgi:hypothetical protein
VPPLSLAFTERKVLILTAKFWNIMSKVVFGISILPLMVAIGFGLHTSSFLKEAIATEAEIIELILIERDGNTLFAPVYVFQDLGGNEIRKYSSTASYPPPGVVGDQIEILYSPEDPNNSRQNTFFDKWGVSVIAGGLGIFYLILSALVIYFTGRYLKKKRSEPVGSRQPDNPPVKL